MYLPPLKPKSCGGRNSYTVWDNLIIFKRYIIISGRVGVLHAIRTILALVFLVISPEQMSKPNSCVLDNFLMVWNVLIIFGRDIDKDQKRCCVQEGQLWLPHYVLVPWNQNLVQVITPLLFEIFWSYLVGTCIRSSKSVTCKKDNCFVLLNPWSIGSGDIVISMASVSPSIDASLCGP